MDIRKLYGMPDTVGRQGKKRSRKKTEKRRRSRKPCREKTSKKIDQEYP